MADEQEVHFVSDDATLAVSFSPEILNRLQTLSSLGRGKETGGVLIGSYSVGHDRAVVTEVTGPPSDSNTTGVSFFRGIQGLQRLINRAWRSHRYYIGEWHLHPDASPRPSPTDIKQMREIASDAKRQCPQPVLVVVGADVAGGFEMTVSLVSPSKVTTLAKQARFPRN